MASAQDVRKVDETPASVSSSLASTLAFVGERGTGEPGGVMPTPAGVTSFGPPGTAAAEGSAVGPATLPSVKGAHMGVPAATGQEGLVRGEERSGELASGKAHFVTDDAAGKRPALLPAQGPGAMGGLDGGDAFVSPQVGEGLDASSAIVRGGFKLPSMSNFAEEGRIPTSAAAAGGLGPPTAATVAAAAASAAAKVIPAGTRPQAPASGVSGGPTSQVAEVVLGVRPKNVVGGSLPPARYIPGGTLSSAASAAGAGAAARQPSLDMADMLAALMGKIDMMSSAMGKIDMMSSQLLDSDSRQKEMAAELKSLREARRLRMHSIGCEIDAKYIIFKRNQTVFDGLSVGFARIIIVRRKQLRASYWTSFPRG